jgi:aspartate kinase
VSADGAHADLTFTVGKTDLAKAQALVEGIKADIGASDVVASDNVGKVSVVAVSLKNHAGVAADMFKVLADAGINIQMISTSEIKISVIVELEEVDRAVNVLHTKFFGDHAAAAAGTDA